MIHITLPQIQKYPQIDLVYLFGSVARGEERAESDIDIAVIVHTVKNLNYGKLYNAIADSINSNKVDVRVIIPKEVDPVFLFEIVKDGKILYKRSEELRIKFETYAMKMYYDTQHYRDIYQYYMDMRFEEKKFAR